MSLAGFCLRTELFFASQVSFSRAICAINLYRWRDAGRNRICLRQVKLKTGNEQRRKRSSIQREEIHLFGVNQAVEESRLLSISSFVFHSCDSGGILVLKGPKYSAIPGYWSYFSSLNKKNRRSLFITLKATLHETALWVQLSMIRHGAWRNFEIGPLKLLGVSV